MVQPLTPKYIPQRTESKDSSRYVHTNVHSSINHNSQNVGTTQVHEQMDFKNVEYICEKEYYSLLKDRNSAICYNMDEHEVNDDKK